MGLRRPFSVPSWWSKNYKLILLYTVCSGVGFSATDTFLPPYLKESGVQITEIGAFFGLASLVGAVVGPLAGYLVDRLGRKVILIAGRVARLMSLAIVTLVPGSARLLPAGILHGTGNISTVAMSPLVAESAPPDKRAMAFAYNGAVRSSMYILLPALTGMIADRFGVRSVILLGMLPLTLGAVVAGRLAETRHGHAAVHINESSSTAGTTAGMTAGMTTGMTADTAVNTAAGTPTPARRDLFRRWPLSDLPAEVSRAVLVTFVVWFIIGIEGGIMSTVQSVYVKDRFGVSYAGLGAVTVVGNVANVAANMIGGTFGDGAGQMYCVLASFGIGAVLWAIVPLTSSVTAYAVMHFATAFIICFAAPAWEALSSSTVPRSARGFASGLYNSSACAGTAVGAMLAGYLYKVQMTYPLFAMVITETSMFIIATAAMYRRLGAYSPKAPAAEN